MQCAVSASHTCQVVRVKLLDGPQKGHTTVLTTAAAVGSLDLSTGDQIRVYKNALPPGATSAAQAHLDPDSFADFDRRGAMVWLCIGFIVLLLATGRFHGLRALVGLVAGMLIVVEFVVPAILHGSSPLAVAVVGAFAVMLVMMPLSYGLGAKALAAWLGTAISLLLAASQSRLSLQGLLVAGMVIGALGVLVDLTVSQAPTVIALRRANPRLRGLIASMPITTALAALLAPRMTDRQLGAAHTAHAH